MFVSGQAIHNAAMDQAYDLGKEAAREGKPKDSNPYATEIEWNGVTYCPTEEQRDAWNSAYAAFARA